MQLDIFLIGHFCLHHIFAVSIMFQHIKLLNCSFFFQLELEIERHCLNQTKKLSDGSYEKIFSRNPRNNFGIYTYNCLLCSVANLPGEIALRTHINGKKHQMKIHYDYIPDAKQFRAPLAIHPKSK